MSRLKEKYHKIVVPEMKKLFGFKNNLAVPRLEKVVLNVGISVSRGEQKFIDAVGETLKLITGQKPVFTKAKKSISSFKIRENMIVGAVVTLRQERMYEFIDKLVNLTLPNVRDFRGLSKKSLDQNGNLTIGFKEFLVFPEIRTDEVENIHGLEVGLVTTAKNREQSFMLLSLLGLPFADKTK